ncbi:serine hydrolase [Pseudooceanicola sp. GBMRC 2024]|uniref:Serine hydrolase n=2 Tax=Paracoccaceae TaxID=31989 RepID=A0A6L7G0D5_9RHOB|nr:serine hydrolase [Pseudooceanicola albus]
MPSSSLDARLDAALDSALDQQRLVGAVVMVSRQGTPLYSRAAGVADRASGRPMRADAIFRLASVSKPFVAATVLRLAQDGVLDLDAPLSRWLPDFRPRLADGTAPAITLNQLLSHTSGLSYGFQEPPHSPYHHHRVSDGLDQPGLALAENLSRLARVPLGFEPGTRWQYSLGLDVLGAVVEAATGADLAKELERLVAAPLGLRDTGFALRDPARLVTPYGNGPGAPAEIAEGQMLPLDAPDTGVTFAPGRIHDAGSYPSGGAGMAGTAAEVLRFLEVICQGGAPLLGPQAGARMLQGQLDGLESSGPGWDWGMAGALVRDPARAETALPAGALQWGGVYGHNWVMHPASGLVAVALTNTAYEGMSGRFVTDVQAALATEMAA